MSFATRSCNYGRRRTNGGKEHNLYYKCEVRFYEDCISTTITSNPVKVSEWISETKPSPSHRLIMGLDTEWRPYYHGNTVAVLQLCVEDRCLIYQIFRSPYVPRSLSDFLSDKNNIFVGVGIKQDLDKLQNDFGIGGNAEYEDLRSLSSRVLMRDELKNAGLKKLAGDVLWKEMDKRKEVTMSKWDKWQLTEEQVQYACIDAFVSFAIYKALMGIPRAY